MKGPDLVRHLKGLADDGQIQLRERKITTSVGGRTLAHARIIHRDSAVDGFGAAATRDGAIDKALWETAERLTFRFSNFSVSDFKPLNPIRRLIGKFVDTAGLPDLRNLGGHSVGCAVHATESRAVKAAVLELIERHTILTAQLMSHPGFEIKCGLIRWNEVDLAISHFCWQGPLRTYAVLSEIRNEGDGRVLYATGAGHSIEAACAKSLLEALGHAENFELESPDQPDLCEVRTISDLKHWHMLNSGRKPFYRPFEPVAVPPKIDDSLNQDRFWAMTDTLGKGLHFARAYSPDIQNLFVGHWEPTRIHPRFRHLWREGMEPPYAY